MSGDVFRPARTFLDAFGHVRMRSEAFGSVRVFSEFFEKFSRLCQIPAKPMMKRGCEAVSESEGKTRGVIYKRGKIIFT